MPNKGSNGSNDDVLSESTPIRIGLVILFLGAFGSAVWWASSINSKLDSILSFQSSITTTVTDLKAQDVILVREISEIKLENAITKVAIKGMQDKLSISPTTP